MILLGPGDTHPIVGIVARRLGSYPANDYLSDELASRIRGAQMRLGLDITGLIDDELIEALLITRVRSGNIQRIDNLK